MDRLISIGELAKQKTGKTIACEFWAKRLIYEDITTLRGRINGYHNLLQRLAHTSA